MHLRDRMWTKISFAIATMSLVACYRTATTASWVAASSIPRDGTVDSVQEVVRRVQGEPVAGAIAGALIGGFLFRGHLPGTLLGAGIGAAASSGSAEHRTYQVLVDFDDGTRGVFVFRDYSPFQPGQRVELSSHGLFPT